MPKLFRILTIDGGGIRGILPAMMLAEIEQRTGKPIWQLFDLIAGTSTGGILALGLTLPTPAGPADRQAKFKAQDLVDMYVTKGTVIFPAPPIRQALMAMHTNLPLGLPFPIPGLPSGFNLPPDVVDFIPSARYPANGISNVLQAYCGTAHLQDALTPILVTSYDIERSQAVLFSSADATSNPAQHDFPSWEIARATSAAPLYFPPYKLLTTATATGYYALVDGGVAANNPAMCAYVEAIRSFKQPPDQIFIVSLGTGALSQPILYNTVEVGGAAQWGLTPLNMLFDGNNQTVQYQMETLLNLPAVAPKYYRFQAQLTAETNEMDDASVANIVRLQNIGRQLIADNQSALDQLILQL